MIHRVQILCKSREMVHVLLKASFVVFVLFPLSLCSVNGNEVKFDEITGKNISTLRTGCFIYRKHLGRNNREIIEYLLLQPANYQHRWTPPKGLGKFGDLRDKGLPMLEGKTGIAKFFVHVEKDFEHIVSFLIHNLDARVVYYLAELVNPDTDVRPPRKFYSDYRWAPFEEAYGLLKFDNLQSTLIKCDNFLRKKFPELFDNVTN